MNPISSNFPLFCLGFPPLSCCFGVFGVLGVGGWVITPSTLTINQSGIGVVLLLGVFGVSRVSWMVITPSTLTINQSGIGVVFGVLGFLGFGGSVDGHHSIHHQSIWHWRCFWYFVVLGVNGWSSLHPIWYWRCLGVWCFGGVGGWVITPSTLNQSGIGVLFGVFVVLGVGG
ncbi:hypothetical protein N7465_007579 [Penicillium sp. CMV-2018d]|nr:hypothetical protein N7465_007579 [Penicillium sp. CMV-2018d]